MLDAMLVLILGAIIFALAYFGKAGKYKTIALVIGGLMFLGGAFYPGYGVWQDTFEFVTDGTADGGAGDYFYITCDNGSLNVAGEKMLVGVASDNEQDITFQLNSDGTHTLDEVYGGVNYSFVATPPAGTSGDDIVTITAEINDEAYVGTNIEVFAQTSNEPNVDWYWHGGGATDNDGTATIAGKWTDISWAELRFQLDSGAADTFADIYDEIGEQYSIDVTFSSGAWSESHTINFYVITDS